MFLPSVSTSVSHLMGKPYSPNTDPSQSFALQLWSGNTIVFAQSNGTPGGLVFLSCPTPLPAQTWTHVAAVVGEGTMSIYINGVLGASATSPGAPARQPDVPFGLGLGYYPDGSPNNNRFPGYARHVRFWNVARSAAQIAAAMTESRPSDSTGLVAHWPLDEASGATARDISGNGFLLTAASGEIFSVRTSLIAAQPFFATTSTAITDGSLQYVNPVGALIDVDRDGAMEVIQVQGAPATFPETRTRVRAFRLQGGAYLDATDSIHGTVTLVAPTSQLVADFNGDGWNDLLLTGLGTDAAPWPGEQSQLLLNDQNGRLVNVTATHLPPYDAAYTHDATYGDIDGDGDLDLYMGNLNVGTPGPRLYLNDGTGNFTDAPGRLPTDIENRALTYTACLLVDLTGDGRAELVLGGWPGGTGTNNEILLNDGAGSFTRIGAPALPPKQFGMDGTVVGITAEDFNGDGRTDLLLSTTDHYFHAALQLLLRQSDGSYIDATPRMGISWSSSVAEIDRSTTVTDINGDGSIDIVAHFSDSTDHSFHVRLLLNRGDATFIEASDILPPGAIGTSFQTGDTNGDDVVDFLSASGSSVTWWRGLKPIALSYFSDPPAILVQPVDQPATVGETVTLSVATSGYPMPTYQWFKNGEPIPSATGAYLTISNAGFSDSGSYSVTATNALGSEQSAAAVLTVTDTFARWRTRHFTSHELDDPNVSGPNAAPSEGLANLVRYALGLARSESATTRLPKVSLSAEDWTFEYTRPSGISDISYSVEASTDLVTWTSVGVTHEVVSTQQGWETWRGRHPLSSAPKMFFRLRIASDTAP